MTRLAMATAAALTAILIASAGADAQTNPPQSPSAQVSPSVAAGTTHPRAAMDRLSRSSALTSLDWTVVLGSDRTAPISPCERPL